MFIEDFGAAEESENSAPAIMLALTALKTGQTLTTRLPSVKLTEAISHTFDATQEYCSVYLPNIFIFDTADTEGGILLDGDVISLGKITLGEVAYKILTHTNIDFSNGIGVELRNFWRTSIDIYKTINYKTGVRLVGGDHGTSANGFALCDIRVRSATCPTATGCYSLIATTLPFSTTPGYFNSNRIACDQLQGQNGILFKKGSLQTDRFNGNEIKDTSVEAVTDIGIDLEFSDSTVVSSTRFEGGNVPTLWVRDDAESIRSIVSVSLPVNTDLFEFNGSQARIDGTAVGVGGSQFYGQTLVGTNITDATGNSDTIYQANRKNASTKNNTVYWGGIAGQDRWAKFAGGVKDKDGNDKLFGLLDPYGEFTATNIEGDTQVPNGISLIKLSTTGASAVKLIMPLDRQIKRDGTAHGFNLFSITRYL